MYNRCDSRQNCRIKSEGDFSKLSMPQHAVHGTIYSILRRKQLHITLPFQFGSDVSHNTATISILPLELDVSCSTFHGYKSEITYCIEFYFIRVSFNTIKTGVAVLQGTKMLGIKLDEALSSACQRNAPNAAASSNSLNPMTALDSSCQQLQFDIWEKRCAVHSFQKSF